MTAHVKEDLSAEIDLIYRVADEFGYVLADEDAVEISRCVEALRNVNGVEREVLSAVTAKMQKLEAQAFRKSFWWVYARAAQCGYSRSTATRAIDIVTAYGGAAGALAALEAKTLRYVHDSLEDLIRQIGKRDRPAQNALPPTLTLSDIISILWAEIVRACPPGATVEIPLATLNRHAARDFVNRAVSSYPAQWSVKDGRYGTKFTRKSLASET